MPGFPVPQPPFMPDPKRPDYHGSNLKHLRKHRHRPRSCGDPPKVPTGIVLTYTATEARTHRRFTGKLKWNEVTETIQNQGTKIKRYDSRIIACEADGTPLEFEDGKHKAHRQVFHELLKIDLKNATIVSGTTAEFTTRGEHSFVVGDGAEIRHVKPSAYNGSYTVSAITPPNKFRVFGVSGSPADGTDFGVAIETDESYHVIQHRVPHPRRWYWKAQVRAVDHNDCPSLWSSWTDPVLPWDTLVPHPENVKLWAAHDRIHITTTPIRVDIDTLGTVSATSGDDELVGVGTHFLREVAVGNLIRVGAETKRVRRVNNPTHLHITGTWASNHTAVQYWLQEQDPDIAWYKFQIARASDVTVGTTPDDWDDVYDEIRTRKHQHAFRIPEDDEDLSFYARVFTITDDLIHSDGVAARRTPNSDVNASGQKVRLLRDRVVKTFTVPGEIIVGTYPQAWRADRDYRFLRITSDVGHPDGAPTGAAILLNVRRKLADLSADAPVLNADDRIKIDAGTFRDVAGEDLSDYNITQLYKGERLNVHVAQIGSIAPGSDLTVSVVLVPIDVQDD